MQAQLLILHVISSLGGGREFSSVLARSFSFSFLFLLKKSFVGSCSHTHTPNSHRQRWKTCFSCFIPVRLVAHNCHLDSSSVFPPFPPQLLLQEEQIPIAQRGESEGDSSFCLDKLLASVVPSVIRVQQGFMVAHMFYMEYKLLG